MKYKVGDKVRIVSKRTARMNNRGEMDHWLGKVMTIRYIDPDGDYRMIEDREEVCGLVGWCWDDKMIAGLADETEEEKASIEFTRAELEGFDEDYALYSGICAKVKKALAELNAPKIGDRCAFWDDDCRIYKVGVLTDTIRASNYKYIAENDEDFKHCAKIRKEAEF